jgi:N-acetylglucosaminyl-diphospho-decaprenol L-rhamnosyltransferase
MNTIAVVIVSYNTCSHLRNCLRTVLPEEAAEVVVVDNGSTDGTIEMVRTEFPGVTLYVDARNRGYGAAANYAIASCSAGYILLLNSDTLLDPGAVREVRQYLEQHPDVGIVGPRLLSLNRSLQPSCYPFPGPLYMLLEESRIGKAIRYIPLLREHYLYTWSHSHARDVAWVQGSAIAIRRTAFEAVNGFDESFFMYFEETDLCYRLKQAGWQVHFNPAANILHVGGGSTRHYRTQMLVQLFKSTGHFYQKHYSAWRLLQLRLLVIMLMVVKVARDQLWRYWSRDPSVRRRLAENVKMWAAILTVMLQRSLISSPDPDQLKRLNVIPEKWQAKR